MNASTGLNGLVKLLSLSFVIIHDVVHRTFWSRNTNNCIGECYSFERFCTSRIFSMFQNTGNSCIPFICWYSSLPWFLIGAGLPLHLINKLVYWKNIIWFVCTICLVKVCNDTGCHSNWITENPSTTLLYDLIFFFKLFSILHSWLNKVGSNNSL